MYLRWSEEGGVFWKSEGKNKLEGIYLARKQVCDVESYSSHKTEI